MTDVKHRYVCSKLAFLSGRDEKATVYTEHLMAHYGTRRYVDIAVRIAGTQTSIENSDQWRYIEVKHDLAFDVGEELRKAADVMSIHEVQRGPFEIAEYVLVLPECSETLDWVEQNAWYLYGSKIDKIVGFNPDNPAEHGFGSGMILLLSMSAVTVKQSYGCSDRKVVVRHSHEYVRLDLSELREYILIAYPGRFGRQSHSPSSG